MLRAALLVGLIAPLVALPALAQTPPPADDLIVSPYPELLKGTLGVEGDLEEDATPRTSVLNDTPALSPWFAWKARIQEATGISFGGSYGVLWQGFSNSRFGEENAVGHKFTFNASKALINAGKPNALTFDIAIEDRRPLGTDFAPLQAGILAGAGLPTAATWGDFNLGITQAYIRQTVAGGRFQYTVGKIFAPNFVDAYPFFDDNRQFLNLAFSTSPTIAVPLRGFGFVGAAYPGAGSLYVKAGMFTANSDDTGSTIGDFFSKNEHFYFVELGQTQFARRPIPIHARGPMDANNIHVTAWYRDPLALRPGLSPLLRPRDKAYGVAFSANRMIGTNYMWFLRGGVGTGGFAKVNVSGGFGYRPSARTADLFGLAAGWSNPDIPDITVPLPVPLPTSLPSQTVGEVFYRLALTPNFAVTPDFQFILNPSLDPRRDTLSVFSLRARLSF
ncbi:carbohydrate porin [Polymorphobacter fuscus]|nr:carbohydrate porin [Polymorphobacter fuscus]